MNAASKRLESNIGAEASSEQMIIATTAGEDEEVYEKSKLDCNSSVSSNSNVDAIPTSTTDGAPATPPAAVVLVDHDDDVMIGVDSDGDGRMVAAILE